MNKKLWVVILVAGIGLIISANIFRDKLPNPNQISKGSPTPSESPLASPSPSPRPSPSSNNIFVPATCQLSGEIRFINKNLYETIGAKIIYQNVDDKIRQIYWKSDPADGVLTAGPNLFEDLPIPNGQSDVGVALIKEPAVKIYTLTASITFGAKMVDSSIEEREARCTGSVKVTIP